MSIASEITRLQGVKSDILNAISAKGVTVPSGSALDDCPALIAEIPTGGGSIAPEGYKIYQRLEMKSGNIFPQGENYLGKIKFNFNDVIILNVDLKPLNPDPNPLAGNLFLVAQASNGYSRFVCAGFQCWKSPSEYYRYDNNNRFGSSQSYPSANISYYAKSTKNSLTMNGTTLNVARADAPEFKMLILGSGVSENWSFYSFKVLDETETTISQYWLPALEIATNKKGIVDIKTGKFVQADNNNNAILYSELNL